MPPLYNRCKKGGAIEAEKLIRAVRSLERNRTLAAKAQERAERAEARVRSFLLINELASVRIGRFQVELHDEDLLVTTLPAEDGKQLELIPREVTEKRADYSTVERENQRTMFQPEDVLTTQEAELLQKADAGFLPCPNPACAQPLKAVKLIADVYEGVVLYCPDVEGCGFREY